MLFLHNFGNIYSGILKVLQELPPCPARQIDHLNFLAISFLSNFTYWAIHCRIPENVHTIPLRSKSKGPPGAQAALSEALRVKDAESEVPSENLPH